MISGPRTIRVVASTLLVGALALVGSAPSVGADRAVPSTAVKPSTLPRGAAPAIPWLDGRKEQIVLPGGGSISTAKAATPLGGRPGTLIHARGGYLLDLPLYEAAKAGGVRQIGNRLNFISDAGRVRTLIARSWYFPLLASSDGGIAVLRSSRANRLRAVRVSDGKVLGTYGTSSQRVVASVKAAGPRQILLQVVTPRSHTVSTVEVVRWDPAHRTTKVIDKRSVSRVDLVTGVAAAASTETNRYATYVGDHSVMVDARTGRTLWRSATREVPLAFSPDNKRVVTVAGYDAGVGSVYGARAQTVRVRDAATGRLQATFTGRIEVGWPDRQPIWESRRTLLLHARDSGGQRVVRCDVTTGRCSDVPVSAGSSYAHLVVRKSN